MKNNILHRILSVILTTIVLLPFTIQTVHALHGHEQNTCTEHDIEHIDQHQVSCSYYHQYIEQNSIDFTPQINLEVVSFFDGISLYSDQEIYTITLKQQSSRAPPYFIV